MSSGNEFPANNDNGRPMSSPNKPLQAFLWIWILGIFALYLFQFRPLMRPILSTLGIL